MRKLKRCPLCNSELELNEDGRYYIHPDAECLFDYFMLKVDDKEKIKRWNTRKPMDRIVERLEEEKSDWNDDYNVSIKKAIEIVKEEGGLNE